MRKGKELILDILGIFIILLLIAVVLITFFISKLQHTFFLDALPLILFCCGIILTIFAYVYSKRAYQIFIGICSMVLGIFIFLLFRKLIPYSFIEWWPVLGVISALTLFIAGDYKYKRIKAGYYVPALVLLVISCIFFLFSFKIIPFSFRKVIIVFGPLLIAFWSGFLFAYYFAQKKFKNLTIREDGPSQFEDDEISPEKK